MRTALRRISFVASAAIVLVLATAIVNPVSAKKKKHGGLRGAVERGGKIIEKGAQDTGKALEKGARDTGKALEKGAQDTGKALEKGAQDTGEAFKAHPRKDDTSK